jgi:hypothetical protein
MEILLPDLKLDEKLLLDAMSRHPGFLVFKKLMESACQTATNRVISLKSTEDDFLQKLASLQSEARAMNEFSSVLIKSAAAHALGGEAELESQKELAMIQKGLLVQSNKE